MGRLFDNSGEQGTLFNTELQDQVIPSLLRGESPRQALDDAQRVSFQRQFERSIAEQQDRDAEEALLRQHRINPSSLLYNPETHVFTDPEKGIVYRRGQYLDALNARHQEEDRVQEKYGLSRSDFQRIGRLEQMEQKPRTDWTKAEWDEAGRLEQEIEPVRDQYTKWKVAQQGQPRGFLGTIGNWMTNGNFFTSDEDQAWYRATSTRANMPWMFRGHDKSYEEMNSDGKKGFWAALNEVGNDPTKVVPFLHYLPFYETEVRNAAYRLSTRNTWARDKFPMGSPYRDDAYLVAAKGDRAKAALLETRDKMILKGYRKRLDEDVIRGKTILYDATNTLVEMIPYGIELALTSGLSEGASAAMAANASKGLAKMAPNVVKAAKAYRWIKPATDIVGGTVMNTPNIVNMAAGLSAQEWNRQAVKQDEAGNWHVDTTGIDGAAIDRNAFIQSVAEHASEFSGPMLGKLTRAAKIGRLEKMISRKYIPSGWRKIAKKIRFDGTLEEIGEEWINNLAVYSAAAENLGAESPDDFATRMEKFVRDSWDQTPSMLLSFSVLPALGMAVKFASTPRERQQAEGNLRRVTDALKEAAEKSHTEGQGEGAADRPLFDGREPIDLEKPGQPPVPIDIPADDGTEIEQNPDGTFTLRRPGAEAAEAAPAEMEAPGMPAAETGEEIPEAGAEDANPERMVTDARETERVESVPLSELNIDPARFQFKSKADKVTGVDESNQIGGEWDPKTAGNLYVWEDKDGRKYVVNGHHRYQLAKQAGVESVNAIVDREADGVTADQARRNGVLINIRDGQGDISDYADFVRRDNLDEAAAEREGVLAREKGRTGYLIGRYASDNLYQQFKSGDIKPGQAAVISDIARGDEAIEAAGIKAAREKMSAEYLEQYLKLLKQTPRQKNMDQGDLFGFDDSALKTAETLSKLAVKHIREVKEKIIAARNAVRNPDAAKKLGVNVGKDAQKLLDKAMKESVRWDKWATDPELYAMLSKEAGISGGQQGVEAVGKVVAVDKVDAAKKPAASPAAAKTAGVETKEERDAREKEELAEIEYFNDQLKKNGQYDKGKAPELKLAPRTAKQERIRKLIKDIFNRDITFYTSDADNAPNGFESGGKIYLNARRDYLLQVALHEFFHSIAKSEEGKRIMQILLDHRGKDAYEKWKENYQNNLAAKGVRQYTEDELLEEFCADTLGMLAGRESFWKELAKKEPSILQKFLNFLREMQTKIAQVVVGSPQFDRVKPVIAQLEAAEKQIAEILREARAAGAEVASSEASNARNGQDAETRVQADKTDRTENRQVKIIGKIWEKNGYKRLYINRKDLEALGLDPELAKYKPFVDLNDPDLKFVSKNDDAFGNEAVRKIREAARGTRTEHGSTSAKATADKPAGQAGAESKSEMTWQEKARILKLLPDGEHTINGITFEKKGALFSRDGRFCALSDLSDMLIEAEKEKTTKHAEDARTAGNTGNAGNATEARTGTDKTDERGRVDTVDGRGKEATARRTEEARQEETSEEKYRKAKTYPAQMRVLIDLPDGVHVINGWRFEKTGNVFDYEGNKLSARDLQIVLRSGGNAKAQAELEQAERGSSDAEATADKQAGKDEGRFNQDSETPLLSDEEDSGDFQLFAETPQEAQKRDQAVEKAEADKLERAKEEARRNAPELPFAGNEEKGERKEESAGAEFGAGNTIFTRERMEAARERMRQRLNRMNSGIDPEFLTDGLMVSGYYVEAGVRKFADYAAAMTKEFGEKIKPYLRSFYEAVRRYPGMEETAKEMSGEKEIEEFYKNSSKEDLKKENPGDKVTENKETGNEQRVDDGGLFGQSISDGAPAISGGISERKSAGNDRSGNDTAASETNGKNHSGRVESLFEQPDGAAGNDNERGDRRRGPVGTERVDAGGNRPGPEVVGEDVSGRNESAVPVKSKVPEKKKVLREEEKNHRIGKDDVLIAGGDASKIKANLAALKLLKELEKENRNATPEEKKVLAKYVGWGGLPKIFEYGHPQYNDLRNLLTRDEWESAMESTINAHYTERGVIEKMWTLASELGFEGGKVGEFGAGIGHFLGLVPDKLADKTKFRAVELDSVTGRMLKKLYPQAEVTVAGLEKTKIANNSLSMVIGNFPFAKEGPYDENYPRFSLHNYFFARAIDAVKSGGLVIALTSNSTMDNAASMKAREWIAEKADLVGAIRLPNNAFKKNAGTEVVTDILVFRKKDGTSFDREDFGHTLPVECKDGSGTAEINEYYVKHPEMVLGENSMTGSMYRGASYTVNPTANGDLQIELGKAVRELAKRGKVLGSQKETEAIVVMPDSGTHKFGEFHVKDGKLYQQGKDGAEEVKGLSSNDHKRILAFLALKQRYNDVMKGMLDEVPDMTLGLLQSKLKKAYDAFVNAFGNIANSRKQLILRTDPSYIRVSGLERVESKTVDGKNVFEYKPSAVFTERTIRKNAAPETAGSLEDAAQISLNYRGAIVPEYVAQLVGMPVADAKANLLASGKFFENPDNGQLETAEKYLSGNIAEKLKAAKAAAKQNQDFQANVTALEKAMPAPKKIADIGFKLGTTWVPADVVRRWLQEDLGARRVSVTYSREIDQWFADGDFYSVSGYSAGNKDAKDILLAALNLKRLKVFYKVHDKTVFDREATEAANALKNQMSERFVNFVKKNPELAKAVEDEFNTKINVYVNRDYSGTGKDGVYPGAAETINGKPVRMREHQRAVIARAIEGNTLIAHCVGAGKTFSMITIAEELKRLGLAHKNLIVVQNSTVEQFAQSARDLYPTASILSVTKRDMEAKNRKRFMMMIANNDWDIIVMPQSQFNMLIDRPEIQQQYMQSKIEDLRQIIEEMKNDRSSRNSVKEVARQLKSLEAKLEHKLGKKKNAEDVVYFDELGIDALFIDEAHAYKKNFFVTKMPQMKGLDRSDSERAMGLTLKINQIMQRTGGRNIYLATGTPITNTLAEAWNMVRYLYREGEMPFDCNTFDRFASMFTETVSDVEQTAAGNYKSVERFVKFVNLEDLNKFFTSVADVVLPEDLKGVKRPPIKGGAPTNLIVPRGEVITNFMRYLNDLYSWYDGLSGEEKKKNTAMNLQIYTMARKASIDMRLIDASLPDDPNSKLSKCAEMVYQKWKEYAGVKGAQAVFFDLHRNVDANKREVFNAYDELKRKLVEYGIPAEEIAHMDNFTTDAKKAQLFEDVNAGRVRVIIGGTQTLGTGVNIQERLACIHHVDVPQLPSDMEQRNGRGIRQGNTMEEVEIFQYAVDRTLDASSYQMLARKDKFIKDVMKGRIGGEAAEESGDQVSYEEFAAEISGNQDARRFVTVKKELSRLKALRNAHAADVRSSSEKLRQERKILPQMEECKKALDQHLKEFESFDAQNLTVDGKKIKRSEFATALDKFMESHKGAIKKVFTINGIPVLVERYWADLLNETVQSYAIDIQELKHGGIKYGGQFTSGAGFMQSLTDTIKKKPAEAERMVGEIAHEKKQIERLQEAAESKFEQEDELNELEAEHLALAQKLTSNEMKWEGDRPSLHDYINSQVEIEDAIIEEADEGSGMKLDVVDAGAGDKKTGELLTNFRDLSRGSRLDTKSEAAVRQMVENIPSLDEKVKSEFVKSLQYFNSPIPGGKRPIDARGFVTAAVSVLGFTRDGSTSAYRTVGENTVRVANHSASMNTFMRDNRPHNNIVSIVVEKNNIKKHFQQDPRVNGVEYVFPVEELEQQPVRLALILHDMAKFFATGEYFDHAGAKYTHVSGNEDFKKTAREKINANAKERERIYNRRNGQNGQNGSTSAEATADKQDEWNDTEGTDSGMSFSMPDIKFSIVSDPETLKKLDAEEKRGEYLTLYRAAQLRDGKLYSPMAAKINGEWPTPIQLGKWEQADEHPELAIPSMDKKTGKQKNYSKKADEGYGNPAYHFKLNKGNGSTIEAAYNPYIHSSPTPLNDQFSEAYKRPELVTLEVRVPKSELTSGYHAEKAKNAVGMKQWKTGVVQGQLSGTREVMLSRWDKPVRIVPDREVAQKIAEMLEGKDIAIPENVVTPSLRAELEKAGVKIERNVTEGTEKPDIRFSISAEVEAGRAEAEELFRSEKDGVFHRFASVFNSWRTPAKGEKKDISAGASVLKNAYYQGLDVPTFGRIVEQAVQMDGHKCEAENLIYGGRSGRNLQEEFASWQLHHKAEYKKLNDYLIQTDIDRKGDHTCTIREVRDKNHSTWQVIRGGNVIDVRTEEDLALDAAFQYEKNGLIADGWNPETAEWVYQIRGIFARQYDLMAKDALAAEKEYKDNGEEVPQEFVSVFNELRKMGDLRTTYFPRIRKPGSYLVYGFAEDGERIMKKATNKLKAAALAESLKRQGYQNVTIAVSDQSSEDLYSDLNLAAMNETLIHAAERLDNPEELTWESIGFTPGEDDYKRNNGKIDHYFTLKGYKKKYDELMKKFGGQWFNGMWRFKRLYRNEKGQQMLLKALSFHSGIVQNEREIMTKNIMAQVADVVRMHGSRSRMISRNDATGTDVFRGYEEDISTAMNLSVASTAGGHAKRMGFRGMIEAMTGTDKSFSAWLKENHPEMVKSPLEMTVDELVQLGELNKEYREFVRDRMIDSSKQPNAYRLAQNFIKDMMRNETPLENSIGFYKSIAGLYFLSRPSSGIINLTTMLINVPAVMSDRLGISIPKAWKYISAEGKRFLAWKAGKLDAETAYVYERMQQLGIGRAEMSKDVSKTVMTWGGRAWRKVMEYGLWCFSRTEELNRSVTTATAFRVLMEQERAKLKPGEKISNERIDELIRKANYDVTLNAHGVYGKLGTPDVMRGSSLLANLARSSYTYKNYQHNTWQLCWDYLTRREYGKLAYVAGANAAVGGLRASPAAALAFFVMGMAGGGSEPPEGYEEAFYRWLRSKTGFVPERFARMGVAGLLGADLRGSMGMEIGIDALPRRWQDFLGAPYSFGEGIVKGTVSLTKGDFYDASQKLLPSGMAAPVRAVNEKVNGIQRRGKPELYEGKPIQPDSVDMILRMLGFNPAAISEKREQNRTMRSVKNKMSQERSELRNDLRTWYRTGRSRTGYLEIFQRIQRYNEQAKKYREKEFTPEDIQQALRTAA